MTNEPNSLLHLYKTEKEKARKDMILRSDDQAEKMIREFFKPERFLKRLTICRGSVNRKNYGLPSFKGEKMSLFGFYLNLRPRERLLNLVDWKPIKKAKLKAKADSLKDKKVAAETGSPALIFEDRLYSAEEIIEEYE